MHGDEKNGKAGGTEGDAHDGIITPLLLPSRPTNSQSSIQPGARPDPPHPGDPPGPRHRNCTESTTHPCTTAEPYS